MRVLHICGFTDALDWRPLFFQDPFIAHSACALCGLLSKKSVRLPCAHTLCLECHEESHMLGGTCPLDNKSFDVHDIVRLDISSGFLNQIAVSCWNSPTGCDFEGPASRLLEHYKQCPFRTVSCPRCQLSVPNREIVMHYKEGCSVSPAAPAADTISANLDYDIGRTSVDLKKGMLKISEKLSSLQTCLNQCRDDLRTTERRTSEQLAAQSSTLSQQFNRHFNQRFTQLTDVKSDIVTTIQAHLAQALRAQNENLMSAMQIACDSAISFHRRETYYWYFKGWEALKQNASEKENQQATSSLQYACGYRVCPSIILIKKNWQLFLGIYLGIVPGANDWRLEWPFRKTCMLGIVNTNDKARNIIYKIEASKVPSCSSFEKPETVGNPCFGTGHLYTAHMIESGGFVRNDSLIFFFEVEP